VSRDILIEIPWQIRSFWHWKKSRNLFTSKQMAKNRLPYHFKCRCAS